MTDKTPIEKAAQALACRRNVTSLPSEELRHTTFWSDAEAVLQAIREPSEGMIMSGIAERHEQPVPEAWSLATENIWRAMIDAALSE